MSYCISGPGEVLFGNINISTCAVAPSKSGPWSDADATGHGSTLVEANCTA